MKYHIGDRFISKNSNMVIQVMGVEGKNYVINWEGGFPSTVDEAHLDEYYIKIPLASELTGPELTCPHCHELQASDLYDYTESADMEGTFTTECEECDKPFTVEFQLNPTVRIKKLTGEAG